MSSDDKELGLELELVLVEQEPKKNKLDNLVQEYQILNNKCDLILEIISKRKAKHGT